MADVACADYVAAPFGNLCKTCQKHKNKHAGFEEVVQEGSALEVNDAGELKQKPRKKRSFAELKTEFEVLCTSDIADQEAFFLKSFIFTLGGSWKDVGSLAKAFSKYAIETNSGEPDLNFVEAADFLQRNGKTRTAGERKVEISDIDLDANQRISFVEYLLLHYKVMILQDYYKRIEQPCPHDLSKGGIGVSGVGFELLDELFYIPSSLPADLAHALEELTELKRVRNATIKELASQAGVGVKGGTAAAKLGIMLSEPTPMDQLKTEARINSALRKGPKSAGAELAQKQKNEKAEEDAKRRASKSRLAEKAKLWS